MTDTSPGAVLRGDACTFRVWAPARRSVEVVLKDSARVISLPAVESGYFEGTIEGVAAGARYTYRLDGTLERPDPASRLQPDGVHGPSAVVDDAWPWRCENPVVGLDACVIYEVHVATFTSEGTFDAAVARLDDLRDLGVTMVELMPVAAFPGTRNWGYDGAYPYAVQASYGGPDGLRRFVDACHSRGIAVILDVVYNHLGPEGTYHADFGPYFTDVYRTPWGSAINFDQRESDGVRDYFLRNALLWVDEYRLDGLRLDAVQAIFDQTARPFLEELTTTLHDFGRERERTITIIAETNRNDPRTVLAPERGGQGHDAMWVDDLHHALHALATGERQGYYADYGDLDDVAQALRAGTVLRGQYSRYRGRRHGRGDLDVEPARVVAYLQNHDQTGNRQNGERITALCGQRRHRLLAAALLLAPFTPLLFMGEEYAEPAPFPYFVDHGDPALIEAVRRGRKRQFRSFAWPGTPPDPASADTFASAKLDWDLRGRGSHAAMLRLYRDLLRLRARTVRRLGFALDRQQVTRHDDVLLLRRWSECHDLQQLVALNFGDAATVPIGSHPWQIIIETGAASYAEEPHEIRLEAETLHLPLHTAAILEA